MAASSVAPHHHARIAALSRDRAPDDPELVDARRSLTEAKLVDHVQRVRDGTPKLTDEQLDRIAGLLRGEPAPASTPVPTALAELDQAAAEVREDDLKARRLFQALAEVIGRSDLDDDQKQRLIDVLRAGIGGEA
jgi:hypothetical protein